MSSSPKRSVAPRATRARHANASTVAVEGRPGFALLSPPKQPAAPSRLALFGGGAIETPDGPVTGRAAQRHRIALLALLASTRRTLRSRDQLIFFLWPEVGAERGRKLLSDSIYRINQALGDVIVGSGDDLRLDRTRLACDVAELEAAADANDHRRVVELHAAPFLDGFYLPEAPDFDQWMEAERVQYRRLAAASLESLAISTCDAGDSAGAVAWWERLVALAPDDSRIATMYMRGLERAGNRAAALRHAKQHAAYLRETLGMEPDRSVEVLAGEMARHAEPSATPTMASIAVLPFMNLSDSEENCYFADGVSEELMFLLARTAGFQVASRTSSFAYRDLRLDVREVGRRLNVTWVLEGSVRRAGDRLRIVAQLTNTQNGYQTWSDSFDRAARDLFSIQAEIAGAIASRLLPALGNTGAPASSFIGRPFAPDAYDLYLQARYQWHRRTGVSLRESARLFEEVVAREPGAARGWAGLADAYAVIAFYDHMPPRVAFPRADDAARHAIQLDPTLAGPYATLGYVETYFHWNWEAAEAAFRRAIEIEPTSSIAHQWYATFLTTRGRFDEAEREMRRAAELDPLSLIAQAGIGWVLALANENARAIRQLEHVLTLDPTFCLASFWAAVAHEQDRRASAADPFHRRAMELAPNTAFILAGRAHSLASAGEVDAAHAILDVLLQREQSGEYISSYHLAKIYLALDDVAEALTRLERAATDRAHDIALLSVDPQLARLRAHPRFTRLEGTLRAPGRERRVS